MCGITGYFNKNNAPIPDTSVIRKMAEIQKHRGPDDSGINLVSFKDRLSRPFKTGQPVHPDNTFMGALGFNRLSIQDLTHNGHQPMSDESGNVTLLFNGEIYNAPAYRNQLKNDGYRFRSTTDTEVIIALYLNYGFEGMVKLLNGMFSIALIDLERNLLYLTRDRFGIKPLYVHETNQLLAFSSEIKSFSCLHEFRYEINEEMVDEYLLFRNTLESSLLKGIDQVRPGTYRTWNGTDSKEFVYHAFNDYHREPASGSFEQSKESLGLALQASTTSQLVSDVKLGCQLSGGIDSSLVTYYAYEKRREQLESVSIIQEDKRHSEVEYIDRVSETIPIISHRFLLDDDYYINSLDRALWHFELPIGHPNSIGIYLLAQQARNHVTVLLSGEGSDELLGGYQRFSTPPQSPSFSSFLSGLQNSKSKPFEYLARYRRDMDPLLHTVMGGAQMPLEIAQKLKQDFSFKKAIRFREKLFSSLSGSHFDKRIKYELMSYLPDLLLRQDKMTMAHSIENRVPFLDNEMLKTAFSIPESHLLKQRGRLKQTKAALKAIAADVFGDSFAYRWKQGFSIPLDAFYKNPAFNERIQDQILPDIKSEGRFNSKYIHDAFNHLDSLNQADAEILWVIISFQAWKKTLGVN